MSEGKFWSYPMNENKLYSRDPFASFLIERLKLTPLKAFFLLLFITILLYALLSPREIFTTSAVLSWLWRLVLFPSLGGYYLWLYQLMPGLLADLDQKSTVDINPDDWALMSKTYQNFRWSYLAISISTLSVAFFITARLREQRWAESWLLELLKTFAVSFGSYMAVMTALILSINTWLIWKLLRPKTIHIEPLHSDGCGGLGVLTQYALKTAYVIATFGIIVGIIEHRFITRGMASELWVVHLTVPLYIGLSLVSFFGPLVTAHHKMLDAKRNLLDRISEQFQIDYQRLLKLNADSNTESLEKSINKIKQIDLIHERTRQFPVWPFNTQALRKYFLSLIAPLLPPVVGLLQQGIHLLLKQWGLI